MVLALTRNDSQLAPQIRQANLRDVDFVHEDSAFRRFHEAEEGQGQRGLPGTSATENANLLTRLDLKVQIVQYVGQIGLDARPKEEVEQKMSMERAQQTRGEGKRTRTAYRMTRSSHLMAPAEGQEADGLGSTNSGGSRLISENSLIRSTATYGW